MLCSPGTACDACFHLRQGLVQRGALRYCVLLVRLHPVQSSGLYPQVLSVCSERSFLCPAGTKDKPKIEMEVLDSPILLDVQPSTPARDRVTISQALDKQDVLQTLKIVRKSILRQLASLPLALGEMGLIAALSVIGTLIDQNEAPAYYIQHYPTDPALRTSSWLDYNVILGLQWDHIYTADYFLVLLALLAASLAACSYTRQWPMVKVARR